MGSSPILPDDEQPIIRVRGLENRFGDQIEQAHGRIADGDKLHGLGGGWGVGHICVIGKSRKVWQ